MWLGSWLNCITSLNGAIRHWFAFKSIFQQKDYVCSIFVSFTMEHSLKIQGGKIQTASLSLRLYECRFTHHRKSPLLHKIFSKRGIPIYLHHSLLEDQQQKSKRRYRKKLAKSEALTLTLTDWFWWLKSPVMKAIIHPFRTLNQGQKDHETLPN